MARGNFTKKTNEAKKIQEVTSFDETKEEVTTTAKVKEKKKFDSEDLISCRSVTVGGLSLEGAKSGDHYRWLEYGDVTEVEYRDLAGLVRSKSSYLFYPYFIVEDDDFIEEFPLLKQFYDESYTVEDLEEILSLPYSQIKGVLDTLPKGAKETIKNIASTQIANGQLDSVRTIKVLDEYFGTELNLLASMFE